MADIQFNPKIENRSSLGALHNLGILIHCRDLSAMYMAVCVAVGGEEVAYDTASDIWSIANAALKLN